MLGTWTTKFIAHITALDILSFWQYNTFIQTGAQHEDSYQSTKAGQGTHCSVLQGHSLQAEGSPKQEAV
jgi:hypothetical protein